MLAGVTGCSGSGQTSVAGILSSLGASVCSLDEIGHRFLGRRAVAGQLANVLEMPGLAALDSHGIRCALRGRAFTDRSFMEAIGSVMHPRMARWAAMAASELRGKPDLFVLEGALMLELGIADLLDRLIVVASEPETCLDRMAVRDRLDPGAARNRLAMQIPLTEKVCEADWVVWNGAGTSPDALKKQVEGIYRLLTGWRDNGSSNS
jgi:dephospho-CoA kinase